MNDALAQLHTCLNQETELVQDFITVLEAEAAALTAGGGEQALTESTARKNSYAEKLAQMSERRLALLTQLRNSADTDGPDAADQEHTQFQAPGRQLYDNPRPHTQPKTHHRTTTKHPT